MLRHPTEPVWDQIIHEYYYETPAPHGSTQRWTYQVPAGRYAVLDHVNVEVSPTTANSQASSWIVIRTSGDVTVMTPVNVRSVISEYTWEAQATQIYVDEGFKVEGWSNNGDSVARVIRVGAILREIIK